MSDLIKHSSESNEHYSPLYLLGMSRDTMGGIDLDPCTSELVNDERVHAQKIYTEADGDRTLAEPWFGRVFMNPPGNKVNNESNVKRFWRKLVEEWTARRVEQAIVVAFSLEALQVTQGCPVPMLHFPFCVAKKRICYDITREDAIRKLQALREKHEKQGKSVKGVLRKIEALEASTDRFVEGDSPPQGSAIIYLPRIDKPTVSTQRFVAAFMSLGYVRI